MNLVERKTDNTFQIPIWYQGKLSLFLYQDNILPTSKYRELLDFLENQNYKAGTCISGKPIPRLQIWYHLEQAFFCEAWKYRYDRWKSELYQPILLETQFIIQQKTKELLNKFQKNNQDSKFTIENIQYPEFNSCLVNKYNDGGHSIKPHQDSQISFGHYPTISNLSMKSSRILHINALSKFKDISTQEISIDLKTNSLFIMAGASQKFYTHSIPKSDSTEQRFSLTFRQHFPYQK